MVVIPEVHGTTGCPTVWSVVETTTLTKDAELIPLHRAIITLMDRWRRVDRLLILLRAPRSATRDSTILTSTISISVSFVEKKISPRIDEFAVLPRSSENLREAAA